MDLTLALMEKNIEIVLELFQQARHITFMSAISKPRPSKTKALPKTRGEVRYQISAHQSATLHDRLPEYTAQACLTSRPRDRAVPNSLAQLRSRLGWSRAQLALVMSCSDRALVNWEQGEPMSAIYAAKVRELQGIWDELQEIMEAEQIGPWLLTDMEAFDGQNPADLIRRGETRRIWDALYHLRSGMPD
jgi:DNA-binding transcriptional regulator YiaG